jgi:single-strand selective monofunctional uracil DNA glycosylase
MKNHNAIINELLNDLVPLKFHGPVTHVYNPLIYARKPHDMYLRQYGRPPKEIVLVGMNPGPWGMAQTGIPFGEVALVKKWLKIQGMVERPSKEHPKRPIEGFNCHRSEVSGRRLWGWAQKTFQTPEKFFKRFFVANYCPLIFMEESGRNRTPNSLPIADRKHLQRVCDNALRQTAQYLKPKFVVGIGNFAADRAKSALQGLNITIGKITHPSPANPRANKDWEGFISKEFEAIGIHLPL